MIDSGDKRKRPTINKLVADRGDYVTLAKTTIFGAIFKVKHVFFQLKKIIFHCKVILTATKNCLLFLLTISNRLISFSSNYLFREKKYSLRSQMGRNFHIFPKFLLNISETKIDFLDIHIYKGNRFAHGEF